MHLSTGRHTGKSACLNTVISVFLQKLGAYKHVSSNMYNYSAIILYKMSINASLEHWFNA